MMKKLIHFRLTLTSIISGLCFLAALAILVPLVIEKIFYNTNSSIFVTQYIFFSFIIFFLILLGVIIPSIRRIFNFLKISKINPFDIISTILLILVSTIPLVILSVITIAILRRKKEDLKLPIPFYRYKVINFSVSIALFLLGVRVNYHGLRDEKARFTIENHTSLLDYLLILLSMGISPKWNVVAGDNLFLNKKGLGNKIIAWSIGSIIKDYAITVDRESQPSKNSAFKKIIRDIDDGKNIGVFSEGGRTPINLILEGVILSDFIDEDGVFGYAWKKKLLIQPVVLDYPAIWGGKNDKKFRIRPCVIDIHYLQTLNPNDYTSVDHLKYTCWKMMEDQLNKSPKIKRLVRA